jgi:hypothetical protein
MPAAGSGEFEGGIHYKYYGTKADPNNRFKFLMKTTICFTFKINEHNLYNEIKNIATN